MFISLLVSFAVGALIGAVIDIVIDVYNEWLSSQKAKELAARETGRDIGSIVVDHVRKKAEYGEDIDTSVFDKSNQLVAKITFRVRKGSSLYEGQTI